MTAREPDDVDARFAEIMAGWDDEADLSDRRTPGGTEGASVDRPGTGTDEPLDPPATAQSQRGADRWLVYRDSSTGLSMGTDHRSWTPPDDPDDETFEPPPPAPMPSMERDPGWWLILAGLVGGPLVILLLTLTGRTSPRLWLWLAGAATVAAFVGLVLRLPRSQDRDPYDDGARV